MTLVRFRGRVNYTNMSRYSELSEKSYRRWFEKKLNFIEFNRIVYMKTPSDFGNNVHY